MRGSDENRKQNGFPESLRAEGGQNQDALIVRDQDALWELMDEWKAAEPSAAFDENVLSRIREERAAEIEAKPWWSAIAGMFGPRGLALAGVAATVVLALVMLRSPQEPAENSSTPAVVQEISVQQVETALEDFEMLDELYSAGTVEENPQNNKI